MKTLLGLALVTAAFLNTGCHTMSMDAKSANGMTTEVSARQGGSCERVQYSRSECDDHVGCMWDAETARCAAH